MNILVAFETLLGSMGEIGRGLDVHGGGSRGDGCGPMTPNAGGVLMGAFQLEFRGCVVEAAQLFPIPRVVAGLASLFGRMRIGVAPGACLIGEMILAGRRRRCSRDMSCVGVVHAGQGFVAVGAQNGRMSVDQNEFRLGVARQVERGGPEGILGVALFAAIFVGGGPEFAAMGVRMAIDANQLARRVRSFFAGGLMTQLAFQLEVFTFELERALLVRFAGKERRLKLHFVMAGVTVRAGSAAFELAAVNVLVTIAAPGVGHGGPKIIVLVALGAVAPGMFPMQRELGFIVIKAAGGKDRFPAGGRMTTLAGSLERRILKSAAVGIRVAALAIRKGQAFVVRGGFSGLGAVTLRAGHALVESSERKGSPDMVKPLRRLPRVLGMAARAVGAQLPSVGVLVTALTFLAEA